MIFIFEILNLIKIIIIVVLVIVALWCLIYEIRKKFDKNKISGGAGADDMGKMFIGMIIGGIEGLTIYQNIVDNEKIRIEYQKTKSFDIVYGRISTNKIPVTSTKIINLEFNENFNTHHRIKNIYTFLYLCLTVIRNKYEFDNTLKNATVKINKNGYGKYELKFNTTTMVTELISDTKYSSSKDIEISNINVNYNGEKELTNLLKNENLMLLIYEEVFKKLIDDSTLKYCKNNILDSEIGGKKLNLNGFDKYSNQNLYGFNLETISLIDVEIRNASIGKTQNFGYNIIKFTFKDKFNLIDDFDTLFRSIINANGVEENFIADIVNEKITTTTNEKIQFITKDTTKYTFNGNRSYHCKLICFLQTCDILDNWLKNYNVTPDLLCVK